MLFQNLSPSPALSITQFSDIDAFRPVEFVADTRSIPLNLANFHTARAMVQLPFCQIAVLTSFPRIVDVSYRAAHGLVIFQLEDDYEVSVNGMSVNRPAFIGMRGNLDLQFVEPRGSLHAIVTLGTGLRDREWFDTPDELCPFTPDPDRWRRSDPSRQVFCRRLPPDRTCCRSRTRRLQCRRACCSPSTKCSAAAERRNWQAGLQAGAIAASFAGSTTMSRFMPPRRSTAPTSPDNAASRSELWARRWRAFAA
jgi:hypothetical protein